VLVPLSVVIALVLVFQGSIQNFTTYLVGHGLTGGGSQSIAMGPVASQEAIKELGTNGGGFFNVNAAHPFENPTGFTNLVEMLAVLIIPASLVFAYGRMAGSRRQGNEPAWYTFTISVWLWLTVVFANLAEAFAEGRGRAQADTLRATRHETVAILRDGSTRPAAELTKGDVVVVEAGDLIPGDGTVIEGIASVDESAITGESAPVIRESGGDRSAVTGGTRVLSDRIVVEITQEPGQSFLDRMIALVEGAPRRKTPNEIALGILLAGLTLIFMVVVSTLRPFGLFSGTSISETTLISLLVALIPTTIGALLSAIGIAGMDRLVRRNVLALSGRNSPSPATRRCWA
jgi:potassium-transporting ATPase ATP-binding subunit